MDDKQFADITRAMGREITRRGALARLAGGLLAATGVSRFRMANVAAQETCEDDRVGSPSGNGICATWVDDNPTCRDLGYANELRIDPPDSGTYNFECGNNTVTVSSDGVNFDWKSTLGIDAVVAKGGDNANVYEYDPPEESFGDTGLHSPINPRNGTPFGLSHILFCYDDELQVSKTATTSFTRTWSWKIAKTCAAAKPPIVLSQNQTLVDGITYEVTVDAAFKDSDCAVSGAITIKNPSCEDAIITGVTDAIGGTNATVACNVKFPHTLAAGATLNCTYSANLTSCQNGTNTVTVTTSGAVGGGTANADVIFGDPTKKVDECINVTDTVTGETPDDLGQVCAGDAPKTFKYSRDVGPYEECGNFEVENTASFTAKDSGATGSAGPCKVPVEVVGCDGDEGCTLTQGYWKTHSEKGPAPYDDTWAELPNGADTLFFLSGQTYYQVLWTPPKGGNVYYQLAHQYIAAVLNKLNGASSTAAVDAAITAAETFFNAKTPTSKLTKAEQDAARANASTLASYNEGATGPGHCSEDSTSNGSSSLSTSSGGKQSKKGKKSRKKGKKGRKKNGRRNGASKENKNGKNKKRNRNGRGNGKRRGNGRG